MAVVVPARNESGTVAGVVSAALGMRPTGFHVDAVLVIDDGSEDGTGAVAASAGATVYRRTASAGSKGAAMAEALHLTDADYVLFLDADCVGLTATRLESICRPVAEGWADISLGTFDYGVFNRIVTTFPLTTGERLIPRELLGQVRDAPGYRIETALNEAAGRAGYWTASQAMIGVSQPTKRDKFGFLVGWSRTVAMFRDLALFYLRDVEPGLYLRYLARVRVVGSRVPRRPAIIRAGIALGVLTAAATALAAPGVGWLIAMPERALRGSGANHGLRRSNEGKRR